MPDRVVDTETRRADPAGVAVDERQRTDAATDDSGARTAAAGGVRADSSLTPILANGNLRAMSTGAPTSGGGQ